MVNPPLGARCLQETHVLLDAKCRSWFSAYGFLWVFSAGSNHSCGTVLLYRPNLTLASSEVDADGRSVSCVFLFHPATFRVFSVYAPNRTPARDAFFAALSARADVSVLTFLCGDFNELFVPVADRRGASLEAFYGCSSGLHLLFSEWCVSDIWRVLHPALPGFMWHRPDGSCASRIDLIGVPSSWLPSVLSDVIPCPFSDHAGMVLRTGVPSPFPPGPGPWPLNVSLLADEEFVPAVTRLWEDCRTSKPLFKSLLRWWDEGKSRLRGLCVRLGVAGSRERSRARDLLSRLAAHLQSRVDQVCWVVWRTWTWSPLRVPKCGHVVNGLRRENPRPLSSCARRGGEGLSPGLVSWSRTWRAFLPRGGFSIHLYFLPRLWTFRFRPPSSLIFLLPFFLSPLPSVRDP